MRLIDAEPLYEKLMNFSVETTVSTSDTLEVRLKKIVDDVLEYYKKTISEAPTVDAVPVIRCKDCAHVNIEVRDYAMYLPKQCELYCELDELPVKPDDFCSYGERKEED